MSSIIEEPGVETVTIRSMRSSDVAAVARIDAEAAGRARPRYFELLMQRSLVFADLQIAVVAEREGCVVGFVIGSLHYGDFGIPEPTATIDAIGVERASRRLRVAHALMLHLRRHAAAVGVTTIRTEVAWNDFELLAFLRSEDFAPAQRLCLERSIDPTE